MGTYKTEGQAVTRVFRLARELGIWPGYYYSRLAGAWVLTYDPPITGKGRHDYEGEVLV